MPKHLHNIKISFKVIVKTLVILRVDPLQYKK